MQVRDLEAFVEAITGEPLYWNGYRIGVDLEAEHIARQYNAGRPWAGKGKAGGRLGFR
jgi:hypothetical protein